VRYAGVGGAAGLILSAAVTFALGGAAHAIWWWPPGTVVFTFAGLAIGSMIEQEVQGGRMDHEDELEARRLAHGSGMSDANE
jgi:hypothetical protein